MDIHRALISVFDKQGIISFAQELHNLDIALISSGGTAIVLKEQGIPLQEVEECTGFPEMLDGRVKTLHPRIHAGILAKRQETSHMAMLKKHDIQPVDMVVVNLYPFEQTIARPKVTMDEVIENIDIGGPTLIRAAAKNYQDVVVITSPHQYDDVLKQLRERGFLSLETRKRLAVEAFRHTAQYDALISSYLGKQWTHELLPGNVTVAMRKRQTMRYGENPHQQGGWYQALPTTLEPCISTGIQLQGKELSFNNVLDADCAIECIKEFTDPTCVIIKHATPCGIASADTLLQAWNDAFSTDEKSPFGGIVCFNREVDEDVALVLKSYFLEVIIAPGFSQKAQKVFHTKKNLRLLEVKGLDLPYERSGLTIRSVVGGFLIQERDTMLTAKKEWKVVTKIQPTPEQLATMEFAVRAVKHVKSNSVLFAKGTQTVGIGGGQTSRVDAAWIATHKGKDTIKGSVMASDAFFPFRDGVDVAAKAGVKAIIQPGGSIRDDEVIAAANEHNIAMVFTGQRYFRH
jgi:phosphoribosylaminoimidazolecarboxamide formyltransferase/IMP cyclohydrolase